MSSETHALTVRQLVKTYGLTTAVDHLDLTVPRGTIFGLLGPNGAGKTTTLECIEGLRPFDHGSITVAGRDPVSAGREFYDAVGVQLQSSGIPPVMTCTEALSFFCAYHGRKPDSGILHRMGLEAKINEPYQSLSIGQQRRLSLALAAAHEPEILFLDEPTAGLDVESRLELHRMIGEFKQEGRTVILATHDMAEAEKLCDTIAIIIRGRLAVIGTPEEVTAAGDRRTTITVSTGSDSVSREVPEFTEAALLRAEGAYVQYATENPEGVLRELLGFIERNNDELTDLRVERPTLEQRFMEIVTTKEQNT